MKEHAKVKEVNGIEIKELKQLDIKDIQDMYSGYLETTNLSSNTIQTARNDAFYLYKKNKEVDFWQLIESPNFEEEAKEYLIATLRMHSKGNIEANVNSYLSHLRRFRLFVLGNVTRKELKKKESSKRIIEKDIPDPCCDEVEKYLSLWDELENYHLQENALDKLFFELAPKNTDISDILLKAATLNDFYSTNIFSIFPVAKHILELNIDQRMMAGDETLIDDIKNVRISDKDKKFYSFATKYCSHHNPKDYPIYDSFVDEILFYFSRKDNFSSFRRYELKNYVIFKRTLLDFQNYYGLHDYSLKELDKYLWQLGKTYFPKKYKS